MTQLGISAFYHDSAACLVVNGQVIAAAEEERFTGIKHDDSFPINAIKYCLEEGRINISDVKEICWYEKPKIKEQRVYKIFNKRFLRTLLLRLKAKRTFKTQNPFVLLKSIGYRGRVKFIDHHRSHTNFSYYTSPFKEAAILTVDGVGEWETVTISHAKGNNIKKLYSVNFPHSLGMLYSTITSYLGFKPNEGEYKVMGLSPYGDPSKYFGKLNKLFDKSKGDLYLLQRYFTWEYSDQVMFNKRLCRLLELAPRLPEEPVTQDHMDLAAALQKIYEREFLYLVKKSKELTGTTNLCLGGGCAYNGVANALAYKYFDSVHVPFAPSDAGSAIGACLKTHTDISPYLGPQFNDRQVYKSLQKYKRYINYYKLSPKKIIQKTAQLLSAQNIVGWVQGRMEFGARALGNRSILASPRHPMMRERLNQVIKKRESFRPFAPSVIEENASKFFHLKEPVPYMNMVVDAKSDALPSATHIDGTCRVQTVTRYQNEKYYLLLQEMGKMCNIPVLLNTSFNLKDQTITLDPDQAIKRFLESKINFLVINNFLIKKKNYD
jgi:carbamoyltransferase